MDLQTLINILVAVAVAHSLKSLSEPSNIRGKVARLEAHMDDKPSKPYPVNLNTRPKALGFNLAFTIVLFLLAFFINSLIDPSTRAAIWFVIILMIVVDIINTLHIDRFHVEIEKTTSRFRK